MAYQSIWYFTDLPKKVVDILEDELIEHYDDKLKDSLVSGNNLDIKKRNSKNAWVPAHHWIGGFIWNYIDRANRENFLYDVKNIDGQNMQYTQYGPGEFYGWHNDEGISSQYKPISANDSHNIEGRATDFINSNIASIRKLSFIMQLSDPDDYEGGNVILLTEGGQKYVVPRQRGTVIIFDSRTMHCVKKVKKGLRKSLVAWAVGPRWK